MLDPLTAAEIQTVRLTLLAFADRQSDQTVRSQCLAVDAKLAEVLEEDNPILRQVLANFVEQLEEALRWAARSTIEKATFHFLTGLRRRGSLRLKERGDPWRPRTNGKAAVNLSSSQIGWKVFPAPRHPRLPSLKPRSPAGQGFSSTLVGV